MNHTRRIEKIVDDALKLAAMGEAYGYCVYGPGIWPLVTPDGQPLGPGPGWVVLVSVKSTGIGEPDTGNYFVLPGALPADELFRQLAAALIEKCRQERANKDAQAMAAASLAAQREAAQGR